MKKYCNFEHKILTRILQAGGRASVFPLKKKRKTVLKKRNTLEKQKKLHHCLYPEG